MELNGDPKNNLAESEGRKTGKIDPKSTGNSQNGPWKGRKRPLGPFSAFQGPFSSFQGPIKIGRALKGFPKCSRRVGKAPGGCGRHLKAFRVILGSFWGVSGHLGHVRPIPYPWPRSISYTMRGYPLHYFILWGVPHEHWRTSGSRFRAKAAVNCTAKWDGIDKLR